MFSKIFLTMFVFIIGSERVLLWGFLAHSQPFIHCSRKLLTPINRISQNPHQLHKLSLTAFGETFCHRELGAAEPQPKSRTKSFDAGGFIESVSQKHAQKTRS
ncbi:MAG: hypothetical protein IIC00_13535 [Planctomycetes bacterium]|nr:hypothetical protein [Planctomycetota bacterium]